MHRHILATVATAAILIASAARAEQTTTVICWVDPAELPRWPIAGESFEHVETLPDGSTWVFSNPRGSSTRSTIYWRGLDHPEHQSSWAFGPYNTAQEGEQACGWHQFRFAWNTANLGDGIGRSAWPYPGALSGPEASPLFGYSDSTVDAADAAYMFQWWGSPFADLTGDVMTDAADAGVLFAAWTGDSAPSSVPEPSFPAWLLLLGLGKRHRV
jgi:hypothetical protein